MSPNAKDITSLIAQLDHLEGWVTWLESSQLNITERRRKTQERGLELEIKGLYDQLTTGWDQLVSLADPAQPISNRLLLADMALSYVESMRRLLRAEARLTQACDIQQRPAYSSHELSLLALDEREAAARIQSIFKTPPSAQINKRPIWIAIILLIVTVLLAILFFRSRSSKGLISTPPPSLPTANQLVSAVGASASPASTPTRTAAIPSATAMAIRPTSTPTKSEVAATSAPLPTNTPVPTILPSPPPTAPPPPRPSRTSPPSPRAFYADVAISFAGLSPSSDRKSCVNGQVLDRQGHGVAGAILQINNGASFSEEKQTDASGAFQFCGLGASRWSVVLHYAPKPFTGGAVGVVEVNGQEGQFARVFFREAR